jgi:hypothetical protein
MPLSLLLACFWVLAAGIAVLAPRRFRWPAAWALIATGIPLLGYVTYETGPVIGVLAFFGGVSALIATSARGASDNAGRDPEEGAWSW